MKILVTGGTGFIGRHLIKELIELGHEVVVLSNEDAKEKPEIVTYIKGDIRDAHDARKAIADCEIALHLAAIVDTRGTNDDEVYAVNFLGAKNIFEVAKAKNAKVIFTSTAAVYGNAQNLPNKETDECKPISQYGKSKLRAERYLQSLMPDQHYIVRMFNVYGPNGHSFINTLCNRIPNFQEVVIYGNGMQTRDFIYVSDAVNAILFGLKHTGLYNVGTDQDYAAIKVVEMIHNITRCKPDIKFTTPNKNDIARSRADITKIRALGWEPSITLEEGIKLVLESTGWKPVFV